MVVVLDDLFGLPVTSGAVGVQGAGSLPPVIRCADRTTLWRALRLRAVQLPYQVVIQPDRMLSIVLLEKFVSVLDDKPNFFSLLKKGVEARC